MNQTASKLKKLKGGHMAEKSVPAGVKVIAVLEYIGAAIALLLAVLMFVGSAFLGSFLEIMGFGDYAAAGAAVAIVGGIIFLALAVLGFFVGRGLWKGQNWARILVIVFSVLGIIGGILSIVQGNWNSIVTLVIYAIIGGYLWFNNGVKAAFS